MEKKEKIAVAIVLLIAAAACGFFAVWEFDFICTGLRTCFFLGYLMTSLSGVFALMEATDNLPKMYFGDNGDSDEDFNDNK